MTTYNRVFFFSEALLSISCDDIKQYFPSLLSSITTPTKKRKEKKKKKTNKVIAWPRNVLLCQKTVLGTDWDHFTSQSRVVFWSINKSLTCILLLCLKSFGSDRFYHICTFRPTPHPPNKKKIGVKEISFLKLSGCSVCTKSHFDIPLNLNTSELNSLTIHWTKMQTSSPPNPIKFPISCLNHFHSMSPFYIKHSLFWTTRKH